MLLSYPWRETILITSLLSKYYEHIRREKRPVAQALLRMWILDIVLSRMMCCSVQPINSHCLTDMTRLLSECVKYLHASGVTKHWCVVWIKLQRITVLYRSTPRKAFCSGCREHIYLSSGRIGTAFCSTSTSKYYSLIAPASNDHCTVPWPMPVRFIALPCGKATLYHCVFRWVK